MSSNFNTHEDTSLLKAINAAHSVQQSIAKSKTINPKDYYKHSFQYSNSDFEDNDDYFKNPLCAPLELVNILKTDNSSESNISSIPAISKKFIKDWTYGQYNEDITEDDFIRLIDGFKWLLNLKMYKFWSQVIYEPNTIPAIKSFIIKKRCNSISIKNHPDKIFNKLYNEVYWLIYKILQRLVHSKTSKRQYIYWLYQQYYFNTYKFFSEEVLLGICGLYGNKYPYSVQMLLEKIFDADSTLSTICISELARNMQKEFNTIHCVHMKQWFTYILNTKTDETSSSTIYNVTLSLLHYIKEFLNERRILIQLYPSAIHWFQNYNISELLCWFYDTDINYINNALNNIEVNNIDIGKERYEYICKKMYSTCLEIVKMFRLIALNLIHCSGFNMDKNNKNDQMFSKKYLELMSLVTRYPKFGKHYTMEYNVTSDIKKIPQTFPNVNKNDLSILQHKIEQFIEKNGIIYEQDVNAPLESENEFFKLHYDLLTNPVFKRHCDNKQIECLDAFKMSIKIKSIDIHSETTIKNEPINKKTLDDDDDDGVRAAIAESLIHDTNNSFADNFVYDAVFDSLITEVKSILPHLGEGFISECLKYYNNNTQEVVSAILEENLPPQLMSLDQSLPLIPEDPIEKLAEDKGHDRRNVFDGDEFDKMTAATFDPKRVFRKKNKYDFQDVKAMLDDKSYVREMAEKYNEYSCDMYDDDYDDFGCEYQVVIGNDLTADEVENKFEHRSKSNKNFESSESSESDDADEQTKPRDAFCEDPAVLRERAEAIRAQKYNNRRGGGGSKSNQTPNRDVVGKPKGQGQDKTVVHNRDHKNTKKSSRANHNRRSGAQWKRNKGMIPS